MEQELFVGKFENHGSISSESFIQKQRAVLGPLLSAREEISIELQILAQVLVFLLAFYLMLLFEG